LGTVPTGIKIVKYQIEFTKGAVKQLKKLPTPIRERIDLRIQELAVENQEAIAKLLAKKLPVWK
jgi:mRNA interferase RelE/StbE